MVTCYSNIRKLKRIDFGIKCGCAALTNTKKNVDEVLELGCGKRLKEF